jgi:hypothetical protein
VERVKEIERKSRGTMMTKKEGNREREVQRVKEEILARER